ncbi:hypothetical protein [Kineococcus sp. SYSU DK001]|uniref:hypothetical protein n=1 Tax=Kineococcus sp. SYSU DK001 TaxID=3383122 RepID=UPI003D7DD0CA
MPPTPDDGSGPLDVDAAFAEIVARWGEDPVEPDRARHDGADPGAEDADDVRDEAQDEAVDEGDRSPRHLAGDGTDAGTDDGTDEPEDRARLIRPAAPADPGSTGDVPDPDWFATPRRPDEDPPELRALADEGFVPADPAPLPRDVVGWAAWVAVVGAPLFLLVVALGWDDVPQLMTAITAGVFVAGFATLVIRLPSHRDDDDDDGAVV